MKKIVYYSLLTIGIIGIIDTIALSLYTNINLGTLFPGIVGSIMSLYGALKLGPYNNKHIFKSRLLRFLIIFGISIAALSFILIESLILINSRSQENTETGYVIILGAAVKGDNISVVLKQRLDKGIDYMSKYPGIKAVVTGGQGFGEDISEAEAMKRYLLKNGISSSRIIMEDKATSTMENFKYSRELLAKLGYKNIDRIMIITSDFHMYRAKFLARRNGFVPYGITSGTPLSVKVNSYIREYMAIIKSYLFDKV